MAPDKKKAKLSKRATGTVLKPKGVDGKTYTAADDAEKKVPAPKPQGMFDKNNTSLAMKIIIVFFAVSLVVSMCLPFFSGCSNGNSGAGTTTEVTDQTTGTTTVVTTVAGVEGTYSTIIKSLQDKLAADPENTTAMASLGNNYMDMASEMKAAGDAADHADKVEAAFRSAVSYYDQYLEKASSDAVFVDRAICMFYAGDNGTAIGELTSYMVEHPDYAMGWFNLGAMNYELGLYPNASEAFTKCVETDPNNEYGVGSTASTYLMIIESIQASSQVEVETTDADEADKADKADDADKAAEPADDADKAAEPADDADEADDADKAADAAGQEKTAAEPEEKK